MSKERGDVVIDIDQLLQPEEFSFAPLETRQQQLASRLNTLREQLEDRSRESKYLEEFDSIVAGNSVQIGSISYEEAEEQETILREERKKTLEYEISQRTAYESSLRNRILSVKEALYQEQKELQEKSLEQKAMQAALVRKREKEIYDTFQRAEEKLAVALQERKAEVIKRYGALSYEDGKFRGAVGHRWNIEWENTPMPVQIRVEQIRGVRHKVPKGRYIVLVSLYDRLGGSPMRWSNIKGQEWFGNTSPVLHNGNHDDIELQINQSVFTVCPPRSRVRASMCFIFEVYLLKSRYVKVPSVFGWGAFPICDVKFDIIEGKFKMPILKGRYDQTIYRYFRMQDMVGDDLDNWLGNLYIDVSHLSRTIRGQKEFEVQLLLTSSALGFPSHQDTHSQKSDGNSEKSIDLTFSSHVHNPVAEMGFNGKSLAALQEKTQRLTKKEILDEYEYALPQPKGLADKRRIRSKAKYLWTEMMTELDFDLWYTPGFWMSFLFLCITLYLRIFIHYLGERFYLSAESIPVSRFEYEPYIVYVEYMEETLPNHYTLGVISFGVFTNILLFIALCGVSWLSQLFLGSFYATASKFVLFYGLAALLDPLLIFIVDIIIGNTEKGDAFKLHRVMEANDGDGIAGVFLTIFIYLVLMSGTALLIFAYFHGLHANGRIHDVYRRLTARPAELFIPDDYEISFQDIELIIENTERWRGSRGERRKIACFEYKTYDNIQADQQLEPDAKPLETITHFAIYEISLGDKKQLYRQFLRNPDGSIVEIFGDIDEALSDPPELRRALMKDIDGNNLRSLLGKPSPYRSLKVDEQKLFSNSVTELRLDPHESQSSTRDEAANDLKSAKAV